MSSVLMIGQSNMAGRGITNSANRLSSERVLKFTKDRKWAEGVEPIHFDRPFTGAGPGLAFARSMADADGHAVIGLIPCAVGGTPLSRWEPGRDLYTNAVSRTKAALASGGCPVGYFLITRYLWQSLQCAAQGFREYSGIRARPIRGQRRRRKHTQCGLRTW